MILPLREQRKIMMTITLPNEIEKMIGEQMATNRFDSPADVMLEALQLLKEKRTTASTQNRRTAPRDYESG